MVLFSDVVSSFTAKLKALMTGSSFTAVTSTVKVHDESESALPSLTLKPSVAYPVPFSLSAGVNVKFVISARAIVSPTDTANSLLEKSPEPPIEVTVIRVRVSPSRSLNGKSALSNETAVSSSVVLVESLQVGR